MTRFLENLTQEEIEHLRAHFDGEARIVIHPYWFGTNTQFDEFLSREARSNRLTIIFEQHNALQFLEDRLKEHRLNGTENILFVKTKLSQAQPISGWQKIIARLKLLGVKKIAIGGHTFDKFRMFPARTSAKILKYSKPVKTQEDYRIMSELRAIARARDRHFPYATYWQCVGMAYCKLLRPEGLTAWAVNSETWVSERSVLASSPC